MVYGYFFPNPRLNINRNGKKNYRLSNLQNMLEKLEEIKKRFQEYENEYEKVLRQFNDPDSLNYFNDRFGYDNPRAEEADRGVRIEARLKKMKKDMAEFSEKFLKEFPSLK